jgi:GTP cyclohydrolase I
MDSDKIAKGVRLILEGIGEDLNREGLENTPGNVAEMLEEILAGTNKQFHIESGLFEEVGDDLILIRNVPFYSLCEHHLLPFFGKIHLAYAPKQNRVAGFSTITRLMDFYAKRLQLQERLTHQIADAVMANLQPHGVFVLIEAQQLCVSMRGDKKETVRTVTQAIRGDISLERLQMNQLFIGK